VCVCVCDICISCPHLLPFIDLYSLFPADPEQGTAEEIFQSNGYNGRVVVPGWGRLSHSDAGLIALKR